MRLWLAAAVLLVTLALGAAAYAVTRPRVSPGARECERGLGAGWTCRTVRVPLDPAKPHGAHVDLAVARFHRPGPARPAVMAFAGGPGGAALPRARRYQQLLAPLLTHRDLVVFDQRGTGVSGRLRCPGVRGPRIAPTAVRTCARQLGARGGRYGSWDTAADAEAVRRSLRVPSVLAFGVSYGTKTATDYARRYPAHVDGLVLDSVVVADTDPLYRRSAVAAARILRALCRRRHCRFDPVTDLEMLVKGARGGRFLGHVGRVAASIPESAVLNEIVEGGADRVRLPAALHTAAASGELGPLLKLADRPAPDVRSDGGGWLAPDFSPTTYLATTCEDASFPWAASASRAARRRAAGRWLARQPDRAYAPFDHRVAAQYGVTRLCLDWPAAHRRAASPPLPDVPALLLAGEEDALTPLEGAREVAAELARSELVVVPGRGHVVLSTTGTAAGALAAWAARLR